MTVVRRLVVGCDVPGCEVALVVHASSEPAAVRGSQRHGWVVVGRRHLCPTHALEVPHAALDGPASARAGP